MSLEKNIRSHRAGVYFYFYNYIEITDLVDTESARTRGVRFHVKTTTTACISEYVKLLSPSETGFIVSAHRLPNITLLTLKATL